MERSKNGTLEDFAILISCPRGDMARRDLESAVLIYETLTCNGSLGPSDVVFLAPVGTRYSEMEPTPSNVVKAFKGFHNRSDAAKRTIFFLDGSFSDKGVGLIEGELDLYALSDLIGSLSPLSAQIFLHGPFSDLYAGKLWRPGRVLAYSSRTDRGKKVEDPFLVSRLFNGDRVYFENIERERTRLLALGYELIWTRARPRSRRAGSGL